MDAKRGFVPEDERNFSPEAISTLKTASRHILYLLNEDFYRKFIFWYFLYKVFLSF